MKILYLLDDKKILKFFADNKISLAAFVKQNNMHPSTLDKVLDGVPVTLGTARKIARAMGLNTDAIILASVSEKNIQSEKEDWYLSK